MAGSNTLSFNFQRQVIHIYGASVALMLALFKKLKNP